MTVETRAAVGSIEFRDATDGAKPGFTARAVNYGVRDSYGTSWAPGVFKESLEARMPPVVWGHDWNDPIGRVVGYREVERRGEGDPGGLEIDVELDDLDAVPRARQAYAQLKSGTMSQFSFGFERQADQADPELRNTTRITKARVQEFSLVLNGAVPGTKPLAIRSMPEGTVELRAATSLIARFAQGELDLAQALTELKELRSVPEELPAKEAETKAGDELPDELVGPADDDEEFERALRQLGHRTLAMQARDRRADAKKPYGDVTYADPGYQKDGKKRYPLDTKDHVKAAWSYINMPKNAKAYSADQLSKIKAKIKAAAKKVGVEISGD